MGGPGRDGLGGAGGGGCGHGLHKLDQLGGVAAAQQDVAGALLAGQAAGGGDGVVAVDIGNDEQQIDALDQAGQALGATAHHVARVKLQVKASGGSSADEQAFGSM